jgi:hypothetical protein
MFSSQEVHVILRQPVVTTVAWQAAAEFLWLSCNQRMYALPNDGYNGLIVVVNQHHGARCLYMLLSHPAAAAATAAAAAAAVRAPLNFTPATSQNDTQTLCCNFCCGY